MDSSPKISGAFFKEIGSQEAKKLSEFVSNAFAKKATLSKMISNLKAKLQDKTQYIELDRFVSSVHEALLTKVKTAQTLVEGLAAGALEHSMVKVAKNLFQRVQEASAEKIGTIGNLRQVIKETSLMNTLSTKISSLIDVIKPQMKEESDSKVLLHSNLSSAKKLAKLRDQQNQDRSKALSYEYKSGNDFYGEDIATAIPTRDSAVLSLTQRLAALVKKEQLIDEKLAALNTNGDNKTIAESLELLKYSKDQINEKTLIKDKQELIKDIKNRLNAEKTSLSEQQDDLEKALKWAARVDRGKYIPTNEMRTLFGIEADLFPTELVNYYKEEMQTPLKITLGSLRRFGVICDWRHGLTNFEEMTKALYNDKLRKEKHAQLEKLLATPKPKLTLEQKEAIENTKKLFESPDALKTAVRERKLILQQQALKAVCDHISDQASKITEPKQEIAFAHESLLNPGKRILDKNGFAHYEDNEIMDMKEAFDMFAGSEITFTDDPKITEPFVDSDGSIKMPRPKKLPKGVDSVIARPIFLNTSVQGHKPDDLDIQFRINRDAFKTLESVMERKIAGKGSAEKNSIRELFRTCQRMNINRKSSYEVAENITKLASLLDLPISLNCFSAKDRTGYVAFRTLVQSLQQEITKIVPDEKKAKKLNDDFGSRGFDNKITSAQIIDVNTGVTCHKVSEGRPPGVENIKAVAQRVRCGIQALKAKGG